MRRSLVISIDDRNQDAGHREHGSNVPVDLVGDSAVYLGDSFSQRRFQFSKAMLSCNMVELDALHCISHAFGLVSFKPSFNKLLEELLSVENDVGHEPSYHENKPARNATTACKGLQRLA